MSENAIENPGYSEENVNNVVRKKRHRRPVNSENESPKHGTGEVDQSDFPKREPRRRRRRDPQSSAINTNQNGAIGVASYLEDLQDDIEIKVNSDGLPEMVVMTTSKGKPAVSQEIGDKVYIEGARNFRVENHGRYLKNQEKMSIKLSEKLNTNQNLYDNDLLQCSIGITNRFRIFATFLHGLFAGMTLMHMIFTLVTGGTGVISQQAFLTSYSPLQQPFAIFNYVAFIIISISLWDRLDVGDPSGRCSPSRTGILVALIITFIAFVINNALYLYNQDFINFYNNNNSTFLSNLVLSYPNWRTLDAVKSVLICVGWFIVALVPVYDRFVDQLNEYMKQELNENY